jgi:hypothetical protein
MILRVWRGWATRESADRYEELIRLTIFPGILGKTIVGLEGLELFRRLHDMGRGQGFRRSELGSLGRAAGRARCAYPL